MSPAIYRAIIILQIILDVIQADETVVYHKESCGMSNVSDQKLTNCNSCVYENHYFNIWIFFIGRLYFLKISTFWCMYESVFRGHAKASDYM